MRRRLEHEKLRCGRKKNGFEPSAVGGQRLAEERGDDGAELAFAPQHRHDDEARKAAIARLQRLVLGERRDGRLESVVQRTAAIENLGEARNGNLTRGESLRSLRRRA